MPDVDHPHRRRRSPLPWMVAIVVGVGAIGAAGVLRGANARTASVEVIDGLEGVLADAPEAADTEYPALNYLLVGSDTREGADPDAPDAAAIGDSSQVPGRRSDTIMILRQEANGAAAIMSIPRDLWVEIAGTGDRQRVNAAYLEGPARLAATVSTALDIPIHHYVEVDFAGFKRIVDEIGGVELCVPNEAHDDSSGLLLVPGCQRLDGTMALAFARSRHYVEWTEEGWVEDPRADLGRIQRQQQFIRAAVDGALAKMASSPFGAGSTIDAVASSVRVDPRLDPIDAGNTLRKAAQTGMRTFALPVVNDTVGDAAVLRLGDGAQRLLDYFRGESPAPVEFETTDAQLSSQ